MLKINNSYFKIQKLKLVFVFTMCQQSCFSQNIVLKSETDTIISKFFQLYSISQKEALKFIFAMPTGISKLAKIDLEKKLLAQTKNLGKYYNYTQLIKIQPSPYIQLVSCFVKHEEIALRISFVFYKPNNNWKLYNFSFDTNIVDEMQEAEKIYYHDYNK